MTSLARMVALPLLATAGCSSGSRSVPSTAAAPNATTASAPAGEELTPCTAAVRGVDLSAWRMVASNGFRICIPPDWKGRRDNWHLGSSTLSWGTGTPPRTRIGVSTVEMERAGQRPVPVRPLPVTPPPGVDAQTFTEQIDGRSANMFRTHANNQYYVGARWDTPAVWVQGQTADASVADVVLTIVRTVRFNSK